MIAAYHVLVFTMLSIFGISHAYYLLKVPRIHKVKSKCRTLGSAEDRNISEMYEDRALREMSIEELVATVELEKAVKTKKAKITSIKEKKEAKRKKEDKIYESYWRKQKKITNSTNREFTEKMYYSVGRDETLAEKVAGRKITVSSIEGKSNMGDEDSSTKELINLGALAFTSAVASFFIYQNVHFGYSPEIDDGWWSRL
jgi:hypothetical protein